MMFYFLQGLHFTILTGICFSLSRDKRKDSKILMFYCLSFLFQDFLALIQMDQDIVELATIFKIITGSLFVTSLINSLSVSKYLSNKKTVNL